MNPKQLEPEQAAAAYTIDRHISVTAGPGSGKTTVLVERYLHILFEKKLSIDQIVAITFTNRAANEMRSRLRERIDDLLQTAVANQRQQWLNYKRTLDGAVITTIHGFCARLLREFPVEAGVDPQFLLLDEHRAAMLLESVVEEVLNEFISSGHVEISRLTLGAGRGKLAAALVQIFRQVRGQGVPFSKLVGTTNHACESDYEKALADLDTRVERFLTMSRRSPKAEAKREGFAAAWPTVRKALGTIPSPEALGDYCAAIEHLRQMRPDKTAAGDLAVEIDDLLWGPVNKRSNDYSGLVPSICFDLFARRYTLEIVSILSRIDERLKEEKQKIAALDFDDLELKALELLGRSEVITRAAERYKFFLVDEFQDTNGLQRRLLECLALQRSRRDPANLFIVGDRKQSIYGFRGADVDVFREMTDTLIAAGGEEKPLQLNFRSQPPLVNFFNYLFARLFQPKDSVDQEQRDELGYVAHEPSEAKRELRDSGPLVEMLISTTNMPLPDETDDPRADQNSREVEAQQLAVRIRALVDTGAETAGKNYNDIALLFRAMTHVQTYESAFRRAGIPYQTVLGRGFYEREEITDLIQLLRFLDNKTDELALAAVLRSPLVGLSDNALLAMRCAPWSKDLDNGDLLRRFNSTRHLLIALKHHREIAYIDESEHELIDGAARLIDNLVSRRHHYSLDDLLRFAVEQSEYLTVVAANFDGAQRLANVERLYTLAARFEQSGNYLIRDFVSYVEEFEAIGSRESEGQIDEAANAVRLMTIHQAKGLEFPVVIIPDLQRYPRVRDNWFLLDRHRGLTLKVPDGRGRLAAGCSFSSFEQRNQWREDFESMRLLYVAATRAKDRLIFSGITKDLDSLNAKGDTWLKWIWQSLDLGMRSQSGVIELAEGVQILLTLNLTAPPASQPVSTQPQSISESAGSLHEAFPLLNPIPSIASGGSPRLSVTQLINYQRCPRQYYFDRVLRVPGADELAVWNNAEAPEPPANLNATLKGAVIHRFCEAYVPGDSAEQRLKQSFVEVIRSRQAQLTDRLGDINEAEALGELWPLAQNYLSSAVFGRAEKVRKINVEATHQFPDEAAGLWSELSFRLRRPWGMITGTIDKLLISPAASGEGVEVEIIDFKTNRIDPTFSSLTGNEVQTQTIPQKQPVLAEATARGKRGHAKASPDQFAFQFSETEVENSTSLLNAEIEAAPTITEQVRLVASDYQLQMQAYALAIHELLPQLVKTEGRIHATLHFLHPNVEWTLPREMLTREACTVAIDEAMQRIINSYGPEDFPVRPARHCGMCSFLRICQAGRQTMSTIGSRAFRPHRAAGAQF